MRYWVIEPFFEADQAEKIAQAFPLMLEQNWYAQHHRHSRKWSCRDVHVMPAVLRETLWSLNALPTLSRIQNITGIWPIYPDPGFYGGGLHQSRPGSFLDLHADFTKHPDLDLRRCLNLLVYMSEYWDPTWGGALQLWDAKVRKKIATIEPKFNTAVLFETSHTSFHGHPDPMTGPETARRNSLALYYYTFWLNPEDRERALKTTDYRARPWEYRERMRKWAGRLLRRLRSR